MLEVKLKEGLNFMPKRARLSVIIPCYRCVDTIDRAVTSIARQTMLPAEVVLVDDCSGDDTLVALYRVQASYPKGWIHVIALSENAGPGTARNVGWEASTQPYVAFLDSDDSWHPQKVEVQYGWMQLNPEIALTGHDSQQVDDEEAFYEYEYSPKDHLGFYAVSKKQLLLANRFPTRSVMLRRDIRHRFADGKRYCEDYQLWVEISCAGLKCYRSNLPLAYFYKAAYGEAGLSASLWRMEKGELGAYLAIFKQGYIGLIEVALLSIWSLARYVRRFVRV